MTQAGTGADDYGHGFMLGLPWGHDAVEHCVPTDERKHVNCAVQLDASLLACMTA